MAASTGARSARSELWSRRTGLQLYVCVLYVCRCICLYLYMLHRYSAYNIHMGDRTGSDSKPNVLGRANLQTQTKT